MPNWVSHKLHITGPGKEIDRLFNTGRIEDKHGIRDFSFDGFIPMPEILKGSEEGSFSEAGLVMLTVEDSMRKGLASAAQEALKSIPWFLKDGDLADPQAWLDRMHEERPEVFAAGLNAKKCLDETGFRSWYAWSIEHWGTKWDASRPGFVRLGQRDAELKFDSAWSSPTPVLEHIAREFPQLTLKGGCVDEGWCFALLININGGHISVEQVDCDADSDRFRELHNLVYGSYPEEDEEE